MPSILQTHRQDLVTGLQKGEIDGQAFGHGDVFTTAVIALRRVAFGVFVGQYASGRLDHGGKGEVFRGDEFEVSPLPDFLIFDNREYGRVEFRQGAPVKREIGLRMRRFWIEHDLD